MFFCTDVMTAVLRPVYMVRIVNRFCRADKSYHVNCMKHVIFSSKDLPVVLLVSTIFNTLIFSVFVRITHSHTV